MLFWAKKSMNIVGAKQLYCLVSQRRGSFQYIFLRKCSEYEGTDLAPWKNNVDNKTFWVRNWVNGFSFTWRVSAGTEPTPRSAHPPRWAAGHPRGKTIPRHCARGSCTLHSLTGRLQEVREYDSHCWISTQGADPPPLPLRVAKAGRNHLNEENYPPPPHWDRRAI
jgi:hypothetical protein